jgi:hypothetical protein
MIIETTTKSPASPNGMVFHAADHPKKHVHPQLLDVDDRKLLRSSL